MPVLSIHDLSFRLPDGRTLFSGLDLSFGRERTGLVGRNGVGKSSLLAILVGSLLPSSGTVRRDGRIALMRQMADTAEGETVADLLGATEALDLLARIEAGEAAADEIAEADWTLLARLDKALAEAGLAGIAPSRPLSTLSGGQRSRAALAALSFAAPDLILMDEPSNNLDAEGRAMLNAFLDGWKGGAVVVSHDRALLNRMDRIVELSPRGARTYGGGFDAYRERKAAEQDAAAQALSAAEREARQVVRAAQQARERQARRDGVARRGRATSSDPKILLDARQERAEATGGRSSRLAARMEAEAQGALARSREGVERTVPFTAGMAAAAVPAGKLLVEARDLAIGHEDAAPLARVDLVIVGPERVALAGPNGSGKSTLLKTIAGLIPPRGGSLRVAGKLAYFDQHVGLLDDDATILDNYQRLNPGASAFECRSALATYAFRADAALQVVGTLSGGERLRAGLACVAAGEDAPELLILDEPTNHLDLDAIAEVEAGLRDYAGALLVVSHDEAFLDAIGTGRRIALG
ncbi:MAG: ATP-binding cassette domain-containing protein [Aquamicrobium sp.]|uniref:ABC-F family ATP-binding cassette domain-containing protein n=1 Tax=Aquamicrobium sp. TaxID=1872579 RepID=UPI00349E7010|nr:ATP-binding cassette domain-containing protein [Aquamicrobium sp.]